MISLAAVGFLARRPFRELSVQALMEATALSRPAFYLYFKDLHELMEALLDGVREGIERLANPWLAGEGEPRGALRESLRGLVEVCAENGTLIRAIAEAAPYDARLERAWSAFTAHWDDAVAARIEAQQADGVVPACDARALANALNALDAAVLIQAFGHRPHADRATVLDTLHRIWSGSLYGCSQSSAAAPAVPPPAPDLPTPKEPNR